MKPHYRLHCKWVDWQDGSRWLVYRVGGMRVWFAHCPYAVDALEEGDSWAIP